MTYPSDAAKLLSTLRDGAWLDRQEFPPLAYAVPGLVPEGSVLLVGPPKIGKSWLVLTIALAAASGGKALGLDIPKRPVLYLALEDGDRRLQDRCRRLLAAIRSPRSSSTRPGSSRVASSTPSGPGFTGRPTRPWSSLTPSARSSRPPGWARTATSATTGSGPRSSASWTRFPVPPCW